MPALLAGRAVYGEDAPEWMRRWLQPYQTVFLRCTQGHERTIDNTSWDYHPQQRRSYPVCIDCKRQRGGHQPRRPEVQTGKATLRAIVRACYPDLCVPRGELPVLARIAGITVGYARAVLLMLGGRSGPNLRCPDGHVLSGDNLIVKRKPDGGFERRCRTCKREYDRTWDREVRSG